MILIKNKEYTFDDFLELTKQKEEIKCKEEVVDGRTVFIFSSMVTLPDTYDSDLARECRGIVFDATGKCICRPFHKFFNVNEKECSQISQINWKNVWYVGTKHDGSMMMPVLINDKIFFKSKKSFYSTVVDVMKEDIGFTTAYVDELYERLRLGWTPIYEFISPNNRIVIEYEKPYLELLCCRNIITGEYLLFPDRKHQNITFYQTPKCIDIIKLKTEEEGVVIHDGNDFFKIKTEWYLERHRAISQISYRELINLILDDKIDDVIAYVVSVGNVGERRLKTINDLIIEINTEKLRLIDEVDSIYTHIEDEPKYVQIDFMNNKYVGPKFLKPFLWNEINGKDYEQELNKYLREHFRLKYSGRTLDIGE